MAWFHALSEGAEVGGFSCRAVGLGKCNASFLRITACLRPACDVFASSCAGVDGHGAHRCRNELQTKGAVLLHFA